MIEKLQNLGHCADCSDKTLTSPLVMTINQRALVSALLSEFVRNTGRDSHGLNALLDQLMVPHEVSHERCIEQGGAS